MSAIFIFAAITIPTDIESHTHTTARFRLLAVSLNSLATTALETRAGLDFVPYADKTLEALVAVNVLLLFRSSRIGVTI